MIRGGRPHLKRQGNGLALLGFTAALFALLAAAPAAAEGRLFGHLQADLVSETLSVEPGTPFTVAVWLSMDPGWHTYWKNPGDFGIPTTIEWDLPAGFAAGQIQWAAPRTLGSPGLETYGYEGQVALLVLITPPADMAPARAVTLRARVNWLVCEKVCIPGMADLLVSLPVLAGAAPADPERRELFATARSRIPSLDLSLGISATSDGSELRLRVQGAGLEVTQPMHFFPESSDLISSGAPQKVSRDKSGALVSVARPVPSLPPANRLAGVLLIGTSGQPRAVVVDIPLVSKAAIPPAASGPGFLLAILFAFLGGVLLNLMPCVLPVLSLKVVSLVGQSPSSRGGAVAHGLSFTAGVLVSFWLLVGLLLALRAGGQLLGWGFQFQNPAVVVVVACLFFVLGLSMFGVFEIGAGVTALVSGAPARKGRAGSFFSGFLATAVATPCTAPFMGSALGYAISQPPAITFAVFTSLALGMALPFLILSVFPSLVTGIPRPGRWMETLKQVMGFPLMASALWMAWVLVALSGPTSVISLLAAFLSIGAGAWVYGRWGGLARARPVRMVAAVTAVVLGAAGIMVAIVGSPKSPPGFSSAERPADGEIRWESFNAARLADLRAAGTPVFIDFTAQWCLTCQVNERVALRGDALRTAFEEKGIAALKADWTDRSDEIAQALKGYGRAGIPLYVLYGKGSEAPTLLPEFLTQGIVLEAVSKLP